MLYTSSDVLSVRSPSPARHSDLGRLSPGNSPLKNGDLMITTSVDPEVALEALFALATEVINEHINDHDLCAVCSSAFPCERAVLAEHNLALFVAP